MYFRSTLTLRPKFTILLVILIAFACADENGMTTPDEANQVNENFTSPFLDSLETGTPLAAEMLKAVPNRKPKVEKVGIPTISQANANIILIESPGVRLAGTNLTVSIPGQGIYDLPKEVKPIGKIQNSGPLKTVQALPPVITDAAYYNLQYLDVDQGLSSTFVTDIMEDSRGNLWISTWSSGVCLYNSRSFVNYDEKSKTVHNYIWSIFEDSKGNIWFGSDGQGVTKYDGDYFTDYTEKDGLSGSVIYKIVEDERQNLWFATENGLTKYDGENFFTYRTENGLSGNRVMDVFMGKNNRLLIATDKGFCIFDGVLFTAYAEKDGLLSNNTTAICEDSEGNIWVGTEDEGLVMFDGYTFFSFNTTHGLSGNSISTLLEDDYNRIWIGTLNNGLSIYDRTAFTQITRREGLSNNTIRCIFQDSRNNIWAGTHGGLNKYNERSFRNYTDEQGLGGLVVRSICEDAYGNLWFGHSNGVSKYDGQTYENYTVEQGLTNNTIRAISQDYKGNIWFATDGGGASYYDGTNFTHYDKESGLSGNIVLCLYEDADQNIWFGTYDGGLTRFDGENFYHLTVEQGLSSNVVRAICQDEQKNIWFGTNNGGLEKFDGKLITHYTKKEGLSDNTVLSLMLDQRGNLWIGTENGGINIFSNDRLFSIGIEDGLSNGIIWSLIEDFENNVWVGTEKGLNLIEIENNNSFKITNFGKLDGLKGTDFYPNSVCLDSENKLWWGTGKALSMLDLNKFERAEEAPKLSITDVLIDQNFVDYRDLKESLKNGKEYKHEKLASESVKKIKFDSIRKFSNFPSNIEVPYDLNHLTIHFSANDWTAPHKIKYAHKLEGASNEWHTLTGDNKVVHSFLPEGDYVFHLKAMGEAEIWSETIQFNITVKPPWWKTVWAYVGYFLLAILIITLITAMRTKKLIQQRKLLENIVIQRTEEVVKQKELVELKNKEIIDSINYAKRIQRAILPSSGMVKRKLANAFIFFRPKDIVAGDFYWLEEKNENILLAAADCTGHGVPGAMVSLVCNNTLGRTVREFNLTQPDLVLNKVRDIVIESFANSREEVKDGMDIALISLNIKTNLLQFSGANNNLYVISNNKITSLKGDRQPIGKYLIRNDFTLQEIQLHPGDTFYMFTDGFIDQFGGPQGKKFKTTHLLTLLLEIQELTMREQKKALEEAFNAWRGDLDQVDDVCILGVRI